MAKRHTERGREQAGMSREGRRTMEKVLENTVRDIIMEIGPACKASQVVLKGLVQRTS